MRRYFMISVKLLIAAALLWYLKSSGRLNLSVFSKVGLFPVLLTFPLYFFSFFIGIVRWKLLINACKLPLSWWDTTRLAMSGNWISSIVPGGSLFSGDVARATIFALENKTKRVTGMTSVLADRIMGLLAIFIISLSALFINYRLLNSQKWLKFVALFLALVVLISVSVAVLLLSRRSLDRLMKTRYLEKIPGHRIFIKVINSIYPLKNSWPSLLKAHLVSYFGHGAMILAIYLLARHIGISLHRPSEYLFAISLGIITAALPVSGPVGIGAGNVGFAFTFSAVGCENGADLALLWQVTFILASQAGLLFFMMNRKKSVFAAERKFLKGLYSTKS